VDDPGSLVVDYALNSDPSESDFIEFDELEPIIDYNAMNEITQTNFTVKITVPDTDADAAVIRVRYVSNNPGENDKGETFYQCSDVSITSSATNGGIIQEAPEKEKTVKHERKPVFTLEKAATSSQGDDISEDHSCCAPELFGISYQTLPTGGGQIFYDSKNQLMRIDFTKPGSDHSMYLNFTSGIEWYFNPMEGSCDEYGLDPWIEWCFGSEGYSETFVGAGTCGDPINEDCIEFTNNNEFTFVATSDECYPAVLNHTNNIDEDFVIYFDPTTDNIDPNLFFPPCSTTRKVGGPAPAHIEAVKATPAFHKSSHKR
jgi:hypothetical protein